MAVSQINVGFTFIGIANKPLAIDLRFVDISYTYKLTCFCSCIYYITREFEIMIDTLRKLNVVIS